MVKDALYENLVEVRRVPDGVMTIVLVVGVFYSEGCSENVFMMN